MARKIQPASQVDVERVMFAFQLLQQARHELAKANAPRALEKVRRAIKSTDGAIRHAKHRQRRTEA